MSRVSRARSVAAAPRTPLRTAWVASLALLLAPLAASAAGLGVPDLGAASLGQGAATIAAPDDLTALVYNPAALAGHPGLRLLLDGRGLQHSVRFQRLQADGSNPDNFVSVSNGGPLRLSPALAAAYGVTLFGMPAAFAAGGYPDPHQRSGAARAAAARGGGHHRWQWRLCRLSGSGGRVAFVERRVGD